MINEEFICYKCKVLFDVADSVLTCPSCSCFYNREGVLITMPVDAEEENTNPCSDIGIHERAQAQYTTSWCESSSWKEAINTALAALTTQEGVALDLGCGDGHYVEYALSQKPLTKTYVVDMDMHNIKKFYKRCGDAINSTELVYIKGNMCDLAFQEGSLDFVSALGSISNVGDKVSDVYKSVFKWLKPGGVFLVSEPSVEGAFYYSLINGKLEEALSVLKTKTKKVPPTGFAFNVSEDQDLLTLGNNSGFTLLHESHSPTIYSLFFGSKITGTMQDDDVKKSVYEALLKYLPMTGDIPRMRFKIWKK
ncbi:class I SAM-dependent methyltransferase [bacterium]|nr:class I SAM-dependent methyltransferase [bacterium]